MKKILLLTTFLTISAVQAQNNTNQLIGKYRGTSHGVFLDSECSVSISDYPKIGFSVSMYVESNERSYTVVNNIDFDTKGIIEKALQQRHSEVRIESSNYMEFFDTKYKMLLKFDDKGRLTEVSGKSRNYNLDIPSPISHSDTCSDLIKE